MNENSNILTNKTLYTTLRPPRCAVLINSNDMDWDKNIFQLFEILSTIWGGDGYILIPTDGDVIDPAFKKILIAYDPDYLLTYQVSGSNLQKNDPKKFDTLIKNYVEIYKRSNPTSSQQSLEQVSKHYTNQLLKSPIISNIKLSKNLKDFILKDLSVYHYHEDIQEHYLSYSSNFPHALTKLIDVFLSKNIDSLLPPIKLDLSNFARDIKLLGYSNSGMYDLQQTFIETEKVEQSKNYKFQLKYNPTGANEINKKLKILDKLSEIKTEKFSHIDFSILLKSIWSQSVDIDGIEFRELIQKEVYKKKISQKQVYNFFEQLPLPSTRVGLAYFIQSQNSIKRDEESPLIIIGDSLQDFCLYYSLLRLRANVFWISYNRLKSDANKPNYSSYTFTLLNELTNSNRNRNVKKINWTTVSLSNTVRSRIPNKFLANNLINSKGEKSITNRLKYVSHLSSLFSYCFRLYEVGNANNYFAYQFLSKKGVSFVNTPKPLTFNAYDPLKHHWITELRIGGYTYPKAGFLSDLVFDKEGVSPLILSTTGTRVSENGIHYQCPITGFISSMDDVNEKLVRPKVNIVSSLDIFKGFFSKAGYEIKLSDKGNYLNHSIEKVSSLDNLVQLIKDKSVFSIFEFFMYSNNTKDDYSKGVFIDKRRYLNFDSIARIVDTNSNEQEKSENKNITIKNIENLLEKNLIYRGFIFKCAYCTNSSWYKFSEIDTNFICKRCGLKNLITQTSLRLQPPEYRSEPMIYYKLDEVFYQFWRNNGYITALTLGKLKNNDNTSLLFLPEVEFRKDLKSEHPEFEIDILAVKDGKILLGEVKKDANSPASDSKLTVRHIEQLLEFSSSIPVSGLIFTSWEDRWPMDVMAKFKEMQKSKVYTLDKYAKNDLLN